jgi:hypothetical protein
MPEHFRHSAGETLKATGSKPASWAFKTFFNGSFQGRTPRTASKRSGVQFLMVQA